jgi:UPF0716 family protein affecting phage T7 exclusion
VLVVVAMAVFGAVVASAAGIQSPRALQRSMSAEPTR